MSKTKHKSMFATKELVLIGMFAAVLAVISQISIPMPSGVPVTIQVFGIALVGTILGSRDGCLATIVYILVGAIGLPIFANFRGGVEVLVGMTGGYILAWPVMALLCGIRIRGNHWISLLLQILLAVIGLMIVEFVGGFQWSKLSNDMSYAAIMAYSFVAFIPKDILITVLAVVLGRQASRTLARAGYLN